MTQKEKRTHEQTFFCGEAFTRNPLLKSCEVNVDHYIDPRDFYALRSDDTTLKQHTESTGPIPLPLSTAINTSGSDSSYQNLSLPSFSGSYTHFTHIV